MVRQTFWGKLKEWIGGICFDIFLWSINMTNDQYRKALFEDELEYQERSEY